MGSAALVMCHTSLNSKTYLVTSALDQHNDQHMLDRIKTIKTSRFNWCLSVASHLLQELEQN